MAIKLGVIFGGESVEHEVSVISAVQAMKALDGEKYEIIPIYIAKNREWYTGNLLRDIDNYKDLANLKRYAKNVVMYAKNGLFVLQSKKGLKRVVKEIDLAFPIVHGTNVEDGTLQGYLKMLGIPFVGSDLNSSVVGQDKVFMKQIFSSSNIRTPKYVWFFDDEYRYDTNSIIQKIEKLKYPVIVKPASLGSSVGISVAKNKEELTFSIETAIKYDIKVLVEEVIPNLVEVNASVLGNHSSCEVSAIEEVIKSEDFLTYEDKYISGSKSNKGMVATSREIPARIGSDLADEVRRLAKEVFRVLNNSGVCRIDFLIDKKRGEVYVNEVNTIPGSLSFYLWEATNKKYQVLLDDMISIAIKDFKKKNKLIYSFETNILSSFNGSKGSKNKLK